MAFAGSSGRAPNGRASTDAETGADASPGARGAESRGAPPQDAQSPAAPARGAQARGAEARGAEARGAEARGTEARGAEARGGPDAGAGRQQTASWRASGQVRRAGAGGAAATGADPGEAPPRRPRGRPFSRSIELDVDWQRTGTFGAGLAVGALLGVSLALLLAPASGTVTRRRIGRAGRRARVRAGDAWAELGEELRHATFRTRRKLRRRVKGTESVLGDRFGRGSRKQQRAADEEAPPSRKPWSRRRPAETDLTVEL